MNFRLKPLLTQISDQLEIDDDVLNSVGNKEASNSVRTRQKQISIEDLRNTDFQAVEFYKNHEMAAKKLNVDLPNTVRLAKGLPLGLRTNEHKKSRFEIAKILSENRKTLNEELPKIVDRYFCTLKQPGEHNVLSSISRPFVRDCMKILSGVNVNSDFFDCLTDILDPALSAKKRLELETKIGILYDTPNLFKAGADIDEKTIRLSAITLGRDTLYGTLSFSLFEHFKKLKGRSMNSLPFPRIPLDSAVPYVWREDVSSQSKNNIHECRFTSLLEEPEDIRKDVFGLGIHTCLGKPHSMQIFEAVAQYIEQIETKILETSASQVKNHVLKLPETFIVKLD